MNLKEINIKWFKELALRYDYKDVKRVAWTSSESQKDRFEAFEYLNMDLKSSILDVGCGVGDYYGFLKEKGFDGLYHGIDYIKENCRDATIKFQKEIFFPIDLFGPQKIKTYDYVVASGIFFLKSNDWPAAVTNTLIRMYQLCDQAVALNFLSIYSDKKYDSMHYASPIDIIPFAAQLSKNFALKHDYSKKGNDFTVFIFK